MDLDYLENALDHLELKPEQVHNVADYCMTNNLNNQPQITSLIDKHFQAHQDPRSKASLFMLTSQLFFLANLKKNKVFFKCLAPKVRPFIDSLVPLALQDIEIAAVIAAALQKWASDQIFAQSFLQKLKQAASPILQKLQEERAGGGKHQRFLKYKKTFLMELMDVQKFAPTCKIYDTFVCMNDLSLKINGFQQAYSRIDFQNPTEDTLKRAKELQRMAQDYKEKLQNIVCDLHRGFKMLSDECRSDFSKLDRTD